MDKKNRLYYDPPKVTAVTFMVENGMLGSIIDPPSETLLDAFGDGFWNGPTSSTSTGYFGDGEWAGGSSFSNNSSFGSGTWDN